MSTGTCVRGTGDVTRGRKAGRAKGSPRLAGALAGWIAAGLLAGLAVPAPLPVHASGQPVVSVEDPRVSVDDPLVVVGSGFARNQDVTVDVCGVPDLTGRLTCSSSPTELTVPISGRFSTTLTAREPSGACPCLVVVKAAGLPPVTTPVDLLGHPVAERAESPELMVDSVRLEGVGGFDSLFTGAAEAELVLEVRNVGAAEARPTLALDTGKAGSEGREPLDDPGVGTVAANESRTVRVPVQLGSFPGGTYEVAGYVVVGDLYAPVQAGAAVRPWGLPLLGIIVAAGAYLQFSQRGRRMAVRAGTSSHRADAGRAVGRAGEGRPRLPVPIRTAGAAEGAAAQPSGARSKGRDRRALGGGFAEVARLASGASRSVIERALQAEAQERREQHAAAQAEHTDTQIGARLHALQQPLAKPETTLRERPVAAPPAVSPAAVSPAAVSPVAVPPAAGPPSAPSEPMIGPPRLERTPIDRTGLGPRSGEPAEPAGPAVAGTQSAEPLPPPGEAPAVDADVVTAYLQATAPDLLAPRTPLPDPLSDPLAAPGAPLRATVPPPLDLPTLDLPTPDLPDLPKQRSSPAGTSGGSTVSSSSRRPDPLFDPFPVEEDGPAGGPEADAAPRGALSAALRERSQAADASVVADALEAIRTHTADAPAQLPDPHAYVPAQRDRRAPKGGKRAAR